LRLFVGNIPKSKSKQEITEEFEKLAGENHCTSYDIFCLGYYCIPKEMQ
jgi:hypothetical protein